MFLRFLFPKIEKINFGFLYLFESYTWSFVRFLDNWMGFSWLEFRFYLFTNIDCNTLFHTNRTYNVIRCHEVDANNFIELVVVVSTIQIGTKFSRRVCLYLFVFVINLLEVTAITKLLPKRYAVIKRFCQTQIYFDWLKSIFISLNISFNGLTLITTINLCLK